MLVKEITNLIEKFAPLSFQESYDNSGLQIGNSNKQVNCALICLDITLNVVEEAISKKCDMIISHHPLLFDGLKKICGNNYIEKIVEKAIQHNLVIYSAHTHLDNIKNGVNKKLSEILGLEKIKVLKPAHGIYRKLVVFCPVAHADKVRDALFIAGAGNIGNYDACSSNTETEGTFRANEKANPFIGKVGEMHVEKEIKIETIYPVYIEREIIASMLQAHPYEEVAYDLFALENNTIEVGSGMIGELESEVSALDFMEEVKRKLAVSVLRYSGNIDKKIKKVAVCGGSGAFLIKTAIAQHADVFITSDIKYHFFGDYTDKLILIDAGHFETEQFTKHLICDILNENFPNFATQISEADNNLVKYFI